MLCNPTQTCFWAGRLTPAIRAMTRSPNLVAGRKVSIRRREHEILAGSRGIGKPRTPKGARWLRHGECAHAPATESGLPGKRGEPRPAPAPRAPQALGLVQTHPRTRPPRESPCSVPGETRYRVRGRLSVPGRADPAVILNGRSDRPANPSGSPSSTSSRTGGT